MASGITQLRGITDPIWNRILKGIQKFKGITSPQNFIIPPPPGAGAVLMEDGSFILLEDGTSIILLE